MTSSFMPQVAECFTSDKALPRWKAARSSCSAAAPATRSSPPTRLRPARAGDRRGRYVQATMVDGVYDKDPHKYADAVRYDTLTFTRVLDERLAVMDSTAATLCRDNGLPILVFDLGQPANIAKLSRAKASVP